MNLGELRDEIRVAIPDPTIETSHVRWLNEAINEVASQFELPALKLKLPATLTTTTSNWQYFLSAATLPTTGYSYMKKVWKVTNSAHERGLVIHRDIDTIDRIDPDHDETGDDVDRVAVEDETDDATLSIYPMANDTLSIWWYRNPVDLVEATGTGVPDGIPAAFHYSILISKVLLRSMRAYPDMDTATEGDNTRALQLWTERLRIGLYGDGYSIGLVQYLQKAQAPRVRGARYGSNLSGSDRFSR